MRYHDTAEICAMDAAPLLPARSRCMTQELWCHNAMQAREEAMIITVTTSTARAEIVRSSPYGLEVKTTHGWVKVVDPSLHWQRDGVPLDTEELDRLLWAYAEQRRHAFFLRIPAVQRYRLNARPAYQRKRRAR